ncbi:hypothetical protein [uncultured Gammaproteobacteria bacterium]|jgi:hypothetical protein|nr:hypothetical protein [uncultured Gammaproteobacteria bacterium]SHE19663.1 hypothetical protein BBROOKSOX_1523 [Bathymodiolus brooksi thiotrophic gill symbiont]
MVKLSVSKAARMLGISRFDIQNQINSGKLQTHEGYVTTDSLRLAYPNVGLNSEQDQHIQKMQQIKNDAIKKIEVDKGLHSENEKSYMGIINGLKTKLYKAQIKNQHYEMVFSELTERLEALEAHCHSQDKISLHKLQGWVKSQH